MTKEDILELAQEAGCLGSGLGGDPDGLWEPTDREIMQMALEALYSAPLDHNSIKSRFFERRHHAIIALRERLAQPDPLQRLTDVQQEIEAALAQPAQEPVAQMREMLEVQQREWQGLTYAEMWTLVDEHLKYQLESYEVRVFNLIRAVEAKLKEKND